MSESETVDGIVIKPEEKVKTPSMYVVVVHNDPYTPRQFVVEVLRRFFGKNEDEAMRIMMNAHKGGHAVVAAYTLEIAETKAAQANAYSKENGKILLFSVEKA